MQSFDEVGENILWWCADATWTRISLLAIVSHLEWTTGPGFPLATVSGHFPAVSQYRSLTACATYSDKSAILLDLFIHSFKSFMHLLIHFEDLAPIQETNSGALPASQLCRACIVSSYLLSSRTNRENFIMSAHVGSTFWGNFEGKPNTGQLGPTSLSCLRLPGCHFCIWPLIHLYIHSLQRLI